MLDAPVTTPKVKQRVDKKGRLSGKILVSGATGFLGRHVLTALKENEACEPLALVRNAGNWHSQQWANDLGKIELVSGSVTRPDAWFDDERLDGLTGIMHLAAVVRHSRN